MGKRAALRPHARFATDCCRFMRRGGRHEAPDRFDPVLCARPCLSRCDRGCREAEGAHSHRRRPPRSIDLRKAGRRGDDGIQRGQGGFRQMRLRDADRAQPRPGVLHDADDPAAMRLLAQVLSTLTHVCASAVMTAADRIRWKTIHGAAKLVRYVTDYSTRSQGDFLFATTAMLKPLGVVLSRRPSHWCGQAVLAGLPGPRHRAADVRYDARRFRRFRRRTHPTTGHPCTDRRSRGRCCCRVQRMDVRWRRSYPGASFGVTR